MATIEESVSKALNFFDIRRKTKDQGTAVKDLLRENSVMATGHSKEWQAYTTSNNGNIIEM